MELVCGQGRLRLDKYASMPQRRCSYFHRFVWECKFMYVIPVYYINAPGLNESEYSHMHAHTRLMLLKSINAEIFGFALSAVWCRWCLPWAESGWSRLHLCYVMWTVSSLQTLNLGISGFECVLKSGKTFLFLFRATQIHLSSGTETFGSDPVSPVSSKMWPPRIRRIFPSHPTDAGSELDLGSPHFLKPLLNILHSVQGIRKYCWSEVVHCHSV